MNNSLDRNEHRDNPDAANAWNPGLQSDIPRNLWPMVTLFRDENAYVSYADAKELADLTGLSVLELVAFRPERLVIHALLVRVTADLSVPDGPNYEELGINLRGMVHTVNSVYMQPEIERIAAAFEAERVKAAEFVTQQLCEQLVDVVGQQNTAPQKKSILQRLFNKASTKTDSPARHDSEAIEINAIRQWNNLLPTCDNRLQSACLRALVKSVGTIVGHRGRLITDHSLITRIVVNQVGNDYGADFIDQFIEPIWKQAIEREHFRVLPAQKKPVIMNVKGASASGKSTIRPQQRQLAEKLGIPWEDFALISPDYWRKYLLDYSSLGEDYKYSAMLTGRELEIIDKKLDRHMAEKASMGLMSHLLIDRFRFDSFIVNIDRTADSKLLSRFGDRVYLFFMVTNPAETVERAWARGIKTGRYKAVDDLLYHNVEAFTGMPSLFLSWVTSKDKQVHFEFLDNDVPEGNLPKTAAFGWNNSMTILDVSLLINIDRYRKVNIAAKQPDQIFKPMDYAVSENTGFIIRCAEKVNDMIFADQQTTEVYATVKNGSLVWWDHDYIKGHSATSGLKETLMALGYPGQPFSTAPEYHPEPIDMAKEKHVTVGCWNAD